MKRMVLSLLVEDAAGVLSRIAGLFSRRGYNIESLTVGTTEKPGFSRMTIVTSGENDTLEQIKKQLIKLVDVVELKELASHTTSVTRELILIKVEVDAADRTQLLEIANVFRAKIIDFSDKSLIIEMTGNNAKVDAFLELLNTFNIKQVARTGITGLVRGAYDED